MQYEKEIILKDGAKCLLRGAGEADAADAPNDELFLLRLLHKLPPCVICWFLV